LQKEQTMRKYPFYFLAVPTFCFVSTCLTGVAGLAVVVLSAAGSGGLAFSYYEAMNFPLISIAAPIAGMFLLAISAPVLLRRRKATVKTAVAESVARPAAVSALEGTEASAKAA
jgi:hypothetical protein